MIKRMQIINERKSPKNGRNLKAKWKSRKETSVTRGSKSKTFNQDVFDRQFGVTLRTHQSSLMVYVVPFS